MHSTNTTEVGASVPAEKTFHTIAAKFAMKGHALNRTVRADDGRVTYTASRWNQSRAFTHWHGVLAFLTQIGGEA